ncbi:MAG: hypothetical protein ABSG80_02210 [Verrucomicrobiota bacterium]|jgi:hypothetical protein
MQSWQIKALELEESALKYLDGIIAGHPLYASFGFVCLFMALGLGLILLLIRGRKNLKGKSYVPPVIIYMSEPPPPPPDTFDPFPPPHHHSIPYDDNSDEYQ